MGLLDLPSQLSEFPGEYSNAFWNKGTKVVHWSFKNTTEKGGSESRFSSRKFQAFTSFLSSGLRMSSSNWGGVVAQKQVGHHCTHSLPLACWVSLDVIRC